MNAFNELFFHLLVATRDATILALAIGGILLLAGDRLSPRWRHLLWLVVVVRLLAPVLPESHLSWQAWLPDSTAVSPALLPVESAADTANAGELPETPAVQTPGSVALFAPPSLLSIVLLTWVTGAVVGLCLLLLGWTRFHHIMRKTRLSRAPFARDLEAKTVQLASAWDMKPPRVVVSPLVHTPSVTGVFRKTLLFPSGLGGKLDDAQLKYVILHELAHFKRRDTLVQWVLCILRIFHWFNPVIWWAFRRIQLESEQAADELVLLRSPSSDRRAYGDTLLRLVELSSQPRRIPGLIGATENPGDIKSRLVAIARFRGGKARGAAIVATVMLTVLSVVGLTRAPSGFGGPGTSIECQLKPAVLRTVAVPFNATLRRSFVRPGDAVTRGQLLAELDGRAIRIEMAEAKAALKLAIGHHDNAMVLEDVQKVRMAQLEADRCNLEVKRLEHQIGNLEIRSPIDGVVLTGYLERSEGVPIEAGQRLFDIGPLERMVVEMAIPEDKIQHIRAAARVQIRFESDDLRTWETTIERILPVPEIRDGKNVFIAEATLKNEGVMLRPGMRGSVRFMKEKK